MVVSIFMLCISSLNATENKYCWGADDKISTGISVDVPMPKMYGSSSLLSSKYYYGSWSKSAPTELCKKGGINRK
tara:strand:- start:252 stop:476 length:225 start_codon:yes stop_codon:yes gene_type:complete